MKVREKERKGKDRRGGGRGRKGKVDLKGVGGGKEVKGKEGKKEGRKEGRRDFNTSVFKKVNHSIFSRCLTLESDTPRLSTNQNKFANHLSPICEKASTEIESRSGREISCLLNLIMPFNFSSYLFL